MASVCIPLVIGSAKQPHSPWWSPAPPPRRFRPWASHKDWQRRRMSLRQERKRKSRSGMLKKRQKFMLGCLDGRKKTTYLLPSKTIRLWKKSRVWQVQAQGSFIYFLCLPIMCAQFVKVWTKQFVDWLWQWEAKYCAILQSAWWDPRLRKSWI